MQNSGANEFRISGNSAFDRYLSLTSNGTDSVLSHVGTGKLRIIGSATNDAASTGDVGETTTSTVASGSAVALTTATAANVTSITLTAGDWDVSSIVNIACTSATHTGSTAGFSTTTATVPTDGSEGYSGVQLTTTTTTTSIPIVTGRLSLASTTTVYLTVKSTFSAGSISAFGKIRARRIR